MDGFVAVESVVLVVFVVVVLGFSVRQAKARSPQGISRRLKFHGDSVTISATGVRGNVGVWNPGKPLGAGNRIMQPGIALYWLGPDHLVHLDFQSRSGHQQFVGPRVLDTDHDSGNRIMLWTVLGGGLVGLSIGYLFSLVGEVGPHPDRRVLFLMAGLALALTVLAGSEWLLARRHRRDRAADLLQSSG